MSTNSILKKCLEELLKESPKIDYIRGMIETLIEIQSPPVAVSNAITVPTFSHVPASPTLPTTMTVDLQDEASILDATARLKLKEVKELTAQSLEQ